MTAYGRVPSEDVEVVRTSLQMAAHLAAGLPPAVPDAWREVAYELVLQGILADWVANGTTELDDNDGEDLANLLRLAADSALGQPPAMRDTAFRVLAGELMRDWVENWNEDE